MSITGKRFKNLIKSFDHPGAQVSLIFKKQPKFQTTLGGVISIFAMLGVLGYFLSLANNIHNKEKVTTFKTMYKGANINNQTNNLNLDNFDLAFGITFYDGLDHTYEK